ARQRELDRRDAGPLACLEERRPRLRAAALAAEEGAQGIEVETGEEDVEPAERGRVLEMRAFPCSDGVGHVDVEPGEARDAVGLGQRACNRAQPLRDRRYAIRLLPGEDLLERHGYHRRMAAIDQLVDELERSYRDVQERLSDPAVYNDQREPAEVGRLLKEIEAP